MRASIVTAALIVSLGQIVGATDASWLDYEPAKVELIGKLTVVPKFGPPNWGESPDTDMKLTIPVLELAMPVSVRGNPKSDTNTETFRDVRAIQLQGVKGYQKFRGRKVVVQGSLFRSQTAWQFTEVIMAVTSISLAKHRD